MRALWFCLVASAHGAALRRAPGLQATDGAPASHRRALRWAREHAEDIVHVVIALHCSRDAVSAIQADKWTALRDVPPERDSIRSRRRRAAQVGQLLGAGYTPRITFLAGLMLRSLQMCTEVRRFFDPSLGYAAGACLGASYSHREWIPCILLGWGVGGAYWSVFRVRPPGVEKEAVTFAFH